jgi:hypothetical protein
MNGEKLKQLMEQFLEISDGLKTEFQSLNEEFSKKIKGGYMIRSTNDKCKDCCNDTCTNNGCENTCNETCTNNTCTNTSCVNPS